MQSSKNTSKSVTAAGPVPGGMTLQGAERLQNVPTEDAEPLAQGLALKGVSEHCCVLLTTTSIILQPLEQGTREGTAVTRPGKPALFSQPVP